MCSYVPSLYLTLLICGELGRNCAKLISTLNFFLSNGTMVLMFSTCLKFMLVQCLAFRIPTFLEPNKSHMHVRFGLTYLLLAARC